MGKGRTQKLVLKKVLVDQIVFSPVNLLCYFATVGLLERRKISYIYEEFKQKGMQNIYLGEKLYGKEDLCNVSNFLSFLQYSRMGHLAGRPVGELLSVTDEVPHTVRQCDLVLFRHILTVHQVQN